MVVVASIKMVMAPPGDATKGLFSYNFFRNFYNTNLIRSIKHILIIKIITRKDENREAPN